MHLLSRILHNNHLLSFSNVLQVCILQYVVEKNEVDKFVQASAILSLFCFCQFAKSDEDSVGRPSQMAINHFQTVIIDHARLEPGVD